MTSIGSDLDGPAIRELSTVSGKLQAEICKIRIRIYFYVTVAVVTFLFLIVGLVKAPQTAELVSRLPFEYSWGENKKYTEEITQEKITHEKIIHKDLISALSNQDFGPIRIKFDEKPSPTNSSEIELFFATTYLNANTSLHSESASSRASLKNSLAAIFERHDSDTVYSFFGAEIRNTRPGRATDYPDEMNGLSEYLMMAARHDLTPTVLAIRADIKTTRTWMDYLRLAAENEGDPSDLRHPGPRGIQRQGFWDQPHYYNFAYIVACVTMLSLLSIFLCMYLGLLDRRRLHILQNRKMVLDAVIGGVRDPMTISILQQLVGSNDPIDAAVAISGITK